LIAELKIAGFKSFREVSLRLGGFNLFVGSNASGKTNFFDALRVLQGIGYGFTIEEIFDGRQKSATSEVWEGIRGGSAYTSRGIRTWLPRFGRRTFTKCCWNIARWATT